LWPRRFRATARSPSRAAVEVLDERGQVDLAGKGRHTLRGRPDSPEPSSHGPLDDGSRRPGRRLRVETGHRVVHGERAGTGAGPRRWVGDRWGRRTDRGSGPQPRVSGGQRWREVSRDRPPRRAGAGSVPVLRAWPAPTQTDPTGSIVVHRRDPPPSPIIRPRKVRPCHCCSSTSSKADTLVRSKRCSTAHAAMVEAFEVPEHPRGQPQAHPRAEGKTLRAAGRAAATRLRSRPG
jgi:hypothetical protein